MNKINSTTSTSSRSQEGSSPETLLQLQKPQGAKAMAPQHHPWQGHER